MKNFTTQDPLSSKLGILSGYSDTWVTGVILDFIDDYHGFLIKYGVAITLVEYLNLRKHTLGFEDHLPRKERHYES